MKLASVYPTEKTPESMKAGLRAIRLDGQISVLLEIKKMLSQSPYFKIGGDGFDCPNDLIRRVDEEVMARDAELFDMAGEKEK